MAIYTSIKIIKTFKLSGILHKTSKNKRSRLLLWGSGHVCLNFCVFYDPLEVEDQEREEAG
jgi:hypothetical protein